MTFCHAPRLFSAPARTLAAFCTLAALLVLPAQARAQAPEEYHGFRLCGSEKNDNRIAHYYVPPEESCENWDRLITIQVYVPNDKGMFVAPVRLFEMVAESIRAGCPGAEILEKTTDNDRPGTPAFLAVHCPKNPETGRPETMAMRSVITEKSTLVVQKTFRGEETRAENPAELKRFVLEQLPPNPEDVR